MKEQKIMGRCYIKIILVAFILFLVGILHNEVTVYADSESSIPESAITINYETQEIKVVLGSNEKLYYGKGSQLKEPSLYDEVMETFIDTVTDGDAQKKIATVDISFLSATKDEYLYIKGDVTNRAAKVLVKKQLKLKANFVGLLNDTTDPNHQWDIKYATVENQKKVYGNFTNETGYIIFFADNQPYTVLEHIEWRKGLNGQWRPLQELNLKKYNTLGAQLYFRINSRNEQVSNESKVNLTKMINSPNIAIDGAKHSIKLTNKMEYRVKVGNGTYGEWTVPTFEGNKTSGECSIASLVGSSAQSNGDGVITPFINMELQVRMAATDKKTISKTKIIELKETGIPAFGNSGIEVALVNSQDLSKGIKVTNHSSFTYQVAVLNKRVDDSTYGAYAAIRRINLVAKSSKEEGYLSFVTVAANKSLVIPYSKYKTFEKDYVVVCRLASIKDDKNTATNEFRLASKIVPVGGDRPVADTASGAVMMDKDQTSIAKTIKYTVEDSNSQVYVSINSGEYKLIEHGEVIVTGSKGATNTIKAYSKNKVTGEISDTISIILTYVSDGELSDYVNEWGYVLCKKEDVKHSSNSRTIAYQRIYLAYTSFTISDITLSDLKLSREEVYNIIQRVRIDNPELLQASGKFRYTIENDYVKYVSLDMIDNAQATNLRIECEAALDEMKAQIKAIYGDTPTKVQKVKVIHDYLVLNNQYKTSLMDQTIAGALCDSYSPVCMAYSMAFKYACDELGIQTVVILGFSGSVTNYHAWNILNLGETVDYATAVDIDASLWYEMDVTWNDPIGAPPTYVGYDYFNITTSKMEAASHTRRHDYYSSYPVTSCTGTTYSYVSVKPELYNTNTIDVVAKQQDNIKEMLERCGEEKPEIKLVK